jgi:hypothetical protein
MLGWIGDAILFVGTWRLGSKKRDGFLWIVAGDVIWSFESVNLGSGACLASCIVFGFMAARNYWKWGRDT